MTVTPEIPEPVYPCMGECGRSYPRSELVGATHRICVGCVQAATDLHQLVSRCGAHGCDTPTEATCDICRGGFCGDHMTTNGEQALCRRDAMGRVH